MSIHSPSCPARDLGNSLPGTSLSQNTPSTLLPAWVPSQSTSSHALPSPRVTVPSHLNSQMTFYLVSPVSAQALCLPDLCPPATRLSFYRHEPGAVTPWPWRFLLCLESNLDSFPNLHSSEAGWLLQLLFVPHPPHLCISVLLCTLCTSVSSSD